MASPHLSNDEFFTQLTDLISTTSSKTSGSVFLTQKALLHPTPESPTTSKDATEPFPSLDDPTSPNAQPKEYPLLIRVTNGNLKKTKSISSSGEIELKAINKKQQQEQRIKLSTVVAIKDLETFFVKYADIAKAGMGGANGGMRKRDRTKRKKRKGGVEKPKA